MPDSLYIHIPFCVQKCIYCDFFSVSYDDNLASPYIHAVCRELSLKKGPADSLKTIYVGGGTPSLLSVECFSRLSRCLADNFSIEDSAEITVEANPGTITESKINRMLSTGVNRLSVGVQSFNDIELKTLGRIHTAGESSRSLELMKKAGLHNVSIDLIYGIPGQTMESWRASVSKALEFSPAHISTYELTPEENTPLHKLIESGKIKMLDEELVLEMYNYIVDFLTDCGYEHYEISNFALPAFKCVHNINYWNRGEYIGAGAGAHSFVGGVRSMNTKDIRNYIENLNQGKLAETWSAKVTAEEALKELIFLGLRKTKGINIMKAARLDLSLSDAGKGLIDEGYLEIENNHLRLTRKGIVISNTIIIRLFDKLGL
jgi:oxygen-independent coproporphyrinogen III oxidase